MLVALAILVIGWLAILNIHKVANSLDKVSIADSAQLNALADQLARASMLQTVSIIVVCVVACMLAFVLARMIVVPLRETIISLERVG